jgi:ABC-type sugar transport system ATPase subunit
MQEILLKMTGISKRFGPVQALSDVNLEVRRGTVNALVGENGAGKSTLMKVLAGVHRPDSGAIEISGHRCEFREPADAINAGISMIYQELDLAGDMSVAENVFLGSELTAGPGKMFISPRRINKETKKLAARYGFDIAPEAKVRDLATGDCQVVEILKALRRRASVIVMDEPTSSLSEHETEKLFSIIKELRAKGISIIYISHRLEHLADDVTILRDGSVVHTAPMSELNIASIVHHMVGRELSDFYPPRDSRPGEVWFSAQGLCGPSGIKDISFEVRTGEIVGMAGLVGAGRTETANAIFGIDALSAGEIKIKGRNVEIKSPADAIKEGIALLTEDRKNTGLCLNLPCSWNITLSNLEKMSKGPMIDLCGEEKTAEKLASRMSVKWACPQAPAASLSGGNQQKLLIARWLMAESDFLIFDEPTRGIDVGAKREVYELLNELAGAGKAILIISSDLPELFGITDRILVMRRRRLAAELKTCQTDADEVMHFAALETAETIQ